MRLMNVYDSYNGCVLDKDIKSYSHHNFRLRFSFYLHCSVMINLPRLLDDLHLSPKCHLPDFSLTLFMWRTLKGKCLKNKSISWQILLGREESCCHGVNKWSPLILLFVISGIRIWGENGGVETMMAVPQTGESPGLSLCLRVARRAQSIVLTIGIAIIISPAAGPKCRVLSPTPGTLRPCVWRWCLWTCI